MCGTDKKLVRCTITMTGAPALPAIIAAPLVQGRPTQPA